MAAQSKIEWTESTWNPVTGCTKISPGCKNCYAERMAKRLFAMGQANYAKGFNLAMHEHVLEVPLKWKKPQTIFVNSMSDLFHKDVPENFIHKVFDVMNSSPWHTFQVLTKRAERLAEVSKRLAWGKNIWMGVSVENADYKIRIDFLRKTRAQVRFISFEPLISNVGKVNLENIDWAIVGGESGPQARYLSPEWAADLRDQCLAQKVPFFFKQWGGVNKKKAGRLLEGRTWDEMPQVELMSV
ncbi:MAG: phage Gp37/Gp68 family protein [Candidatus Omnitrophica bacterium]|nr:phage Gp37/Gp68 family protein [Candidatus Omnitrophota bacterium]MBU4479734.1 phage Gp37/Gp68 family protein [Candidatus Omnitrophota bacterium]